MSKRPSTLLALAAVVLASGAFLSPSLSSAATEREKRSPLHAQIDAAIEKVKPALIRIRVVSTEFSAGREVKVQAVGSGAIISKDGYIITNHHVAGHATRMFCTLWNREEIEAELIATDPLTDISVIKLLPEKPRSFAVATFGDSDKVRVGDSVLAMGSPMALSQSITLGIISNTELVIPRFWGDAGQFKLDGENVGALVRWIGHDAAIYGGNSGGPLVNLSGQIIGINEISYGLSGAIPGNLAKRVAEQLIAKGRIERSWLGVDVQPLFKHSHETRGVLISGVLDESPASAAGLRAGDVMLSLNGVAADVRFDEQIPEFMALSSGLPIGKAVPIVILRDGRELTLTLSPTDREDIFPAQTEVKPWGIAARNLSSILAREMKRETTSGVLVASVRPGGPAGEAKPALQPRDVLVEVNGQAITNLQALEDFTRRITTGQTAPVPVIATFERRAARFLSVIKVGLQDVKDPGLEVTKAWLPVETQVISRDIATQLGDPALKGFYVTRVYAGSTAAKAGLKPGDFITAVDDEKLAASGPEFEDELSSLIRQYDVGKTVELAVRRGRELKKVPVELERSPRLRREMKKYRNNDFEFTVRDVSFFDAADEQLPDSDRGVMVEEVKSGSWAELGGLDVDDLIEAVDGQSVANVADLRKSMERIADSKTAVVTFRVLRGIHTLFLELEPNWKN